MSPRRFLGIVLGGCLLIALAAPWWVAAGQPQAADRALLLSVLLIMIAGVAWWWMERHLLAPFDEAVRALRGLAESRSRPPSFLPTKSALGTLPVVMGMLEQSLQARQVPFERAAADTVRDRDRLEAVLRDLSEGVLVCGADHRILLYNEAAARLLGQQPGLGLGRRLSEILEAAPLQRGLELLQASPSDGQAAPAIAAFSLPAPQGTERLEARMTLSRPPGSGRPSSEGDYVLCLVVHREDHRVEDAACWLETPAEHAGILPPRPEFYDFDLLRPENLPLERAALPLSRLRFAVLDCETTGLRPSEGDRIVSLAAVRVVNGRLLQGEVFETLVDPQRDVPVRSTRFHGLTASDLAGQPPIREALRHFAAFAGADVLVGHNVAFDLKFLRMVEAEAGVQLENPVLDTMLLSRFLEPEARDHSLEAVARRCGIPLKDRHTALGDALVTARILLLQIERLEARGLYSLKAVVEQTATQAEIKRLQAEF